jgi:SapC
VLKFLGQREFHRTQAFCKKLKDLNLLEPMQAQINLGSGERMALGGFSVVDRARLKTLSSNVSMRNFATVRDRLAEAQPAHSTR